ncbi:MAG: hypothetical protein LBH68_07195 [Bifidobacteriaceae bacterium]|jgi:hypothetical protein|nr:hypothetical protein [Bifidobacteriaceae bacterium]
MIRGQVAGLEAVWFDRTGGLLQACLVCRAGTADETYASLGVTEEIVLAALRQPWRPQLQVEYTTGPWVTEIKVGGPAELVSEALGAITDRLASPDESKLARARGLLYGRWAGSAPMDLGLLARFGLTGVGLHGVERERWNPDCDPPPLPELRPRFTAANCWLCLDGVPPADLDLALPAGPPPALPAAPPNRLISPVFFHGQAEVVASGLVPWGPAGGLFGAIASERMTEVLRRRDSVAYSPWFDGRRLSATETMIAIGSDSPADHGPAAAGQFIQIVTSLTAHGPTAAEMASLEARSYLDVEAGSDLLEAQLAAIQLAFGAEPLPPDARQALVRSVTPDDIRLAAGQFGRSLVMGLPVALDRDEAHSVEQELGEHFPPRLFNPDSAPPGRYSPRSWADANTYQRLRGLGDAATRAHQSALCGPEGLALVCEDDQQFVRWDEQAMLLSYNDLAVEVTGLDRQSLLINPNIWRDGQALLEDVLRHSDPRLTLRLRVPDPAKDSARPPEVRRTQPMAPVGWFKRWFRELTDPASIGSLFVECLVTLGGSAALLFIWLFIWAPVTNTEGPIGHVALAVLLTGALVGIAAVITALTCTVIGHGRLNRRILRNPRTLRIAEERRRLRAQRTGKR